MRKLFSYFVLLAAGLLVGTNAWAAYTGTGTSEDPYVVDNATDFKAVFVNESKSGKVYIKLGGNITPEDAVACTAQDSRYLDLNSYELKANLSVPTNKSLYLNAYTGTGTGTFTSSVTCSSLYIGGMPIVDINLDGALNMSVGAQIKGTIRGTNSSKKATISNNNVSFEGTLSGFMSLTIGSSSAEKTGMTINSTGTPFFEGSTTIYAGTFNFDPEDVTKLPNCTIPSGYVSVNNDDGTWTVKKKKVILKGVMYDDFASAYDVVQPNETIEVYTPQKISSDIDQAITIQGNGTTITLDQSVTIEDVTFDGVSSISLYGSAPSNIDVKMKNCSVTSSSSTIHIQSNVNSLSLLNCSISSSSSNVIKTGSLAVPQVDIDGCALVANGYTAGIDCGRITVLNVNNTTISSIGSAISCSSTCTCNLKGNTELTTSSSEVDVIEGLLGTYNINPYTVKFNKDISSELKKTFGFTTQQEGDWYVVTSATAPVVLVKGDEPEVNYYSLETALTAATEDDIVKLNADQSIPVTIPAGKKVTIDLNGNKITCLSYKYGTKMLSVLGDLTIMNSAGSQAQWGEPVDDLTGDYCLTPAINIANGGKLTINGDVVIDGNGRAIQAEAGSELYLDGATVSAKYNAAVYFEGAKSVIKNSTISSLSSTALTPNYFSYAVHVSGNMTIEGTTVNGVHGAVGVLKEGTRLTVRDCDLQAHHTSGKNDCHAALYVCTYAVVDVWNTNMKSDREHYAALVGNNDVSNEWGVINLYDGCLLSDKMYVQLKKDETSSFPAYIPKNSDWYKLWKETTTGYTGEGPLPTGYSYQSISESGYLWKVVAPASTQDEYVKEDVTGTTIPWGEATTWSNNLVPNENTIATIPDKKQVVIGDGETANAYQVFIGGDNAKLTVSEDAFLTVGDGGMNIADGGQMVIEPGAVVKVGAAGVINSSDDAIVIKAEKDKAGAFLIGPAVTEATHPYATVEMYTKARESSPTEHRWQHFAIPTNGKPSVTPLPHDKQEDANLIYIYEWNYDNQEWQTLGSWDNLNVPFQGYNLTNNLSADKYAQNGGVTYVFHGNIIGNGDGDLKFLSKGYNFFGNSYTAPIDIATMFQYLDANIEKTIAIYDVEKNQYIYSNNVTIELGFGATNQINPLQGFFLNAKIANPGNPTINYENAVYKNPNLQAGHGGLAAPARQTEVNANTVAIHVEANGNADCITLVEMNDLSDDFEDGFDATKLMNESNLNLYANTMAGKLGIVATDDLVGTTMDFQSNDATQYTMTFSNVNGQVYDLLDVMTGVRTRMEEGATYTFNAGANITTANRFQICVAHTLPTGFETIESQAAAQGIYTILGQPMGHNWNRLPAGVYVINGERVVKF